MKEIDNLKISKKLIKAIISGAVFTILGGTAWAWSRPKKQDLSKIDHYGNPYIQEIVLSDENYDIDWKKINEKYKGVILESNQGMTKDKKFDEYYAEAKKEKIAVGALYKNDVWDYEEYNYLHNENFKEDVNYEIDFLLSNLKGKKMTLPVILELDTENLSEKLSQQDAKYLLDTYKEKIESAGYIPGLSVNEEGLAYLKDACSESLEGYDTMREQKTSADSLEYYTRAVDTDGKVFNAPSIAREINTTIDYEYRDGREVYPLTGMGLYAVGLGTVETRKKLKEKTKVKTK